jgi:flagellar assembly factor FliW
MIKVNTTRFGVLEVEEDAIIKMHRGLLGFESITEYVLIQHRPDTSFRWMQSITESELAFVVVDPGAFFDEYDFDLSDAEAQRLELQNEEDALVLVVVTIGKNGQETTANLAAPIVINSRNLTAMQVVIQESKYEVREPLIGRVKTQENMEKENELAKAA